MKTLLLTNVTAIALAVAAPAMAADMPVKAPPVAAPVPYNWTGFYVGGNVGYGWASATDPGNAIGPGAPPAFFDIWTTSEQLTGATGGGQIGYNWQIPNNRWVFGLEADIQASGQSGTGGAQQFVAATGAPVAGLTTSDTDKIRSFGTMRGRIGYAADRWMVYGTGGFAWQNVSSSMTITAVAPPHPGVFPIMSNSATLTGWVAGGGVEVGLWNNWTAKLEYLHIDTGTWNNTTGALAATSPLVTGGLAPAGTVFNESTRITNNIVRVGANYRF